LKIAELSDLVDCDIYIPNYSDKLDIAIAEFINNYPERQKIRLLFLRRKDGEYQFGKKKVNAFFNNDG